MADFSAEHVKMMMHKQIFKDESLITFTWNSFSKYKS